MSDYTSGHQADDDHVDGLARSLPAPGASDAGRTPTRDGGGRPPTVDDAHPRPQTSNDVGPRLDTSDDAARPGTSDDPPAGPTGRAATADDGISDGGGTGLGRPWSDPDRLPPELAERFADVRLRSDRGAQAIVYEATDLNGRRVAVRVFRLPSVPDDDAYRRLAEVDHPNVLRLLDWGMTAAGHRFDVAELLEGRDLHEHLAGGRLGEREALRLIEQLGAALVEVHRRRLWHRDIKPENIVVVRTAGGPRYVLIDFGVAHAARHTRESRRGPHTAEYAPPEAYAGGSSSAWDWWSLGITVLELVRGSHPFAGHDTDWQLFDLVQFEPIRLAAEDRRLRRFLQGVVHRDHRARWDDDTLVAFLAGEDPEVFQGELAAPVDAPPHALGRRQVLVDGAWFRRADLLGQHLAADWDAAGRALGASHEVLWEWARQFDNASLLAELAAVRDTDRLDHALMRVIAELERTPPVVGQRPNSVVPVWMGVRLTPGNLRSLCRTVAPGDDAERGEVWTHDAAVLTGLVEGALDVAVGVGGSAALRGVRDRWRRSRDDFAELAVALRTPPDESALVGYSQLLLWAEVDPARRARLLRRADDAARGAADLTARLRLSRTSGTALGVVELSAERPRPAARSVVRRLWWRRLLDRLVGRRPAVA